MATDRYGNEIANIGTDRYGNPISYMQQQPSYEDYTKMRRTQSDQMSRQTDTGGDTDSSQRGYEGGTDIGAGVSAAMGLGARAAKFGGAEFGFGVGSAIGAARAGVKTGSTTEAAKTGVIGLAGETLGAVGGIPGMVGKAALGVATAEDPSKTATKTTGSILGGVLGGPLGAIAGGLLGGAAYGSVKEGLLGDITDSRSQERERDTAERMGYDYGQTADMAGVDASRAAHGDYGVDPGISSEFGVGLSPGLSDVDPFGGLSLGEVSFGGEEGERDAAGNEGGGADSGGPDSDGGGHGARGGGNEGTSEAGGIGGY